MHHGVYLILQWRPAILSQGEEIVLVSLQQNGIFGKREDFQGAN